MHSYHQVNTDGMDALVPKRKRQQPAEPQDVHVTLRVVNVIPRFVSNARLGMLHCVWVVDYHIDRDETCRPNQRGN